MCHCGVSCKFAVYGSTTFPSVRQVVFSKISSVTYKTLASFYEELYMKRHVLVISILIGLVSCSQTTKTKREGEPTIYSVPDDDEEMNDAIKTANQTLDKFREALKSGNPDLQYFSLKSGFETPDGFEHIWVSNITLQENQYFGVVNNLPESR